MVVIHLPSIDDYWNTNTRIPQVADLMSSKWFKRIRATLHFNDNDQTKCSQDRFFKIRPVINYITKQFLEVPAMPMNSVDEVMVAYKGIMAGNL